MEALWTRFLPAINEAEKIVNQGKIGEILGIKADFCFAMEPQANRIYLNELAGGSLLDVGVYGLHFAAIFLGYTPEKIIALANTDGKVDIHTNMLLKYKSGAIANISSAIGLKKPATAYIYGTKGHISIPYFYGPTELFISTDNGEEHIIRKSIGDGFEEQIIESCQCIANGKLESDILPLDKSISILKQMDEIRSQIGITYPFECESDI